MPLFIFSQCICTVLSTTRAFVLSGAGRQMVAIIIVITVVIIWAELFGILLLNTSTPSAQEEKESGHSEYHNERTGRVN